ncbi:MAG TPA: ROK family transcriptional regulator [Bauldia sp.]|nr:ROK family transcriptional regulator [Bauldia sp.]
MDAPGPRSAVDGARQRSVDPSRGTNQSGVRLYNERLVLSLIRRHGSLAKAEIARLTGLSAQTISVIMRALEADDLVRKQAPQRGKIGQPSVPFSLNPSGAYFLGLKIGRRSSDLVLLDFHGRVLGSVHEPCPYPTPEGILDFAARAIKTLVGGLSRRARARISGLGIASPFELWNWEEQIGAPRASLDGWRDFDIRGEIGRICDWPVYFYNDATAACGAELVLGNPGQALDFLYFFIGSFAGGGVVLNGSLFPGRTGNAGALGSLPIPAPGIPGASQQLIRSASVYVLEQMLRKADRDPSVLWRSPDDWGEVGPELDQWIGQSAAGLAAATVAAISVIDFESVIIDGAFPTAVRRRLVEATAAAMAGFDLQGLSPVSIREGTIGSGARAIGGACLPLLASFTRDRELLFKEAQ